MPKTAQEIKDYNAKKADYMRKKRAHAKNEDMCKSIVKAIAEDASKIAQARYKCKEITQEIADSKIADMAESLVVNALSEIDYAKAVIADVDVKRNQASKAKQAYRIRLRTADKEAYLQKQRDYRAKRKAEEMRCLDVLMS
jgi:hypothetical protein